MEKIEEMLAQYGITTTQLLIAIICLVAFVLAIKFLKGLVKLIVVVVIIAVLAIGIATGKIDAPDSVKEKATILVEKGTELYEIIEANKDKVKLESGEVSILIGDKWVSTNDIKSIVKAEDGTVKITLGGEEIVIEDEVIKKVLGMMTKEQG